MRACPTPAPRGTELSLSWCRDQLVAHAVGLKTWGGVNYYTVAQNITGLMRAGSEGVNHGEVFVLVCPALATDLTLCTGIAVDGIVTLLTVSATEKAA